MNIVIYLLVGGNTKSVYLLKKHVATGFQSKRMDLDEMQILSSTAGKANDYSNIKPRLEIFQPCEAVSCSLLFTVAFRWILNIDYR